ncbi:MAG: hypothetical protein R3A10_00690 [Caldilineaceae bacterium]
MHHNAALDDGSPVTREMYTQIRVEELAKLGGAEASRYGEAADLLDQLCLADDSWTS